MHENVYIITLNSILKLPPLPEGNDGNSMVITNDNKILSISGKAGDGKQCHIFQDGHWKHHSVLNKRRVGAVAITTKDGIYCFGGQGDSRQTSEFLPNNAKHWQEGPMIPEDGIRYGHGVAISPTEILLIGGAGTEHKVCKLDVTSLQWSTAMPDTIEPRRFHSSAFFKGKVVVTGGDRSPRTSEIIDLTNGTSRRVGDLNVPRSGHGMGILQTANGPKLIIPCEQNYLGHDLMFQTL